MEAVVAGKKIHAPFRYAGGKFYALKHILPLIPEHTCYVEPFCGGSRVYFAKSKAKTNWLNDVDAELINCYVNIRDRADEMVEVLSKEVATKERHAEYKRSEPADSLGRAIRWYYLNRTSFSGIMKIENCYFGYGEKYSCPPPVGATGSSHVLPRHKASRLRPLTLRRLWTVRQTARSCS